MNALPLELIDKITNYMTLNDYIAFCEYCNKSYDYSKMNDLMNDSMTKNKLKILSAMAKYCDEYFHFPNCSQCNEIGLTHSYYVNEGINMGTCNMGCDGCWGTFCFDCLHKSNEKASDDVDEYMCPECAKKYLKNTCVKCSRLFDKQSDVDLCNACVEDIDVCDVCGACHKYLHFNSNCTREKFNIDKFIERINKR